jgi:Tol biopolymer transport system component
LFCFDPSHVRSLSQTAVHLEETMPKRWIKTTGILALVIALLAGGFFLLKPNAHPAIVFMRMKIALLSIYTYDLTTGEEKQIIADPYWKASSPTWSPDGSKIAFVLREATSGDLRPGIYSMNPDGTDLQYIYGNINAEIAGEVIALSWSPDGAKIAFTEYGDGDIPIGSIYTVNVNGNGLQRLTFSKNREADMLADWSPDGLQIVFTSQRDSDVDNAANELYIMNADGSNQRLLTRGLGSNEQYAKWSPDGQKIVFESHSYRISGSSIFIVDVHDPDHWQPVVQIPDSETVEYNLSPEWSPDGKQIIFAKNQGRDRAANLYTVNIDGTNLTQITVGDTFAYLPSWRP